MVGALGSPTEFERCPVDALMSLTDKVLKSGVICVFTLLEAFFVFKPSLIGISDKNH